MEEIAAHHSVPYVDNEAVFNGLLSAEGAEREDYFMPDGHCNDRGCGVIARNIYDKMVEENMFGLRNGD